MGTLTPPAMTTPNATSMLQHLDKERDELMLKLSTKVKAELVTAAKTEGALHWIELYTKHRRLLGYLNRLPQELGRYADSIDGMVRAKKLLIGQSAVLPLHKVETWYYKDIEEIQKDIGEWYKGTHPDFIERLEHDYTHILIKNTVADVADAWVNEWRSMVPSQIRISFWKRVFCPAIHKIEYAAHVRGLANILKSELFRCTVKNKLKEECRTEIANIEIRILGHHQEPTGVMVVPDVEDTDYYISDFISNTGLINNINTLMDRYPTLKQEFEQIQKRLAQIRIEMENLEAQKNGEQPVSA